MEILQSRPDLGLSRSLNCAPYAYFPEDPENILHLQKTSPPMTPGHDNRKRRPPTLHPALAPGHEDPTLLRLRSSILPNCTPESPCTPSLPDSFDDPATHVMEERDQLPFTGRTHAGRKG